MNLWGLWPHQEKAIQEIETAWSEGIRSVCFQCPTGSGKSRVLRQIVDNHAFAKKVIYIIAHRKNLVNQLSEEISEAKILHGIIASGKPYIRYRVQVASLMTIIKRIDKLPEPELIIIDEFHHAKSKSYLKLLNKWSKALVLGVTATPERLDGKPLSDICQKLIVGPSMRNLIESGYLSDFEYYAPQTVKAPKHMSHGDYRLDEIATAMDQKAIIGNVIDHYRKHADKLPAIASCASIEHAEHVAEGFKKAGYKAKAIHSKLSQTCIEKSLKGLKTGEIEILTQCELLGEGIDIPGATVLIGLRHTASLTVFLQHAGRVLRKHEGKKHAIILDHVGNYLRHGLPDDHRDWSLKGRPKREKTESDYKRCPECLRVVPKTVRQCPFCGQLWTEIADRKKRALPEEKDGTLEKVKKTKVLIDWYGLINEIKIRAKTLKAAHVIAKNYGYKPGAAYSIWVNILKKTYKKY